MKEWPKLEGPGEPLLVQGWTTGSPTDATIR